MYSPMPKCSPYSSVQYVCLHCCWSKWTSRLLFPWTACSKSPRVRKVNPGIHAEKMAPSSKLGSKGRKNTVCIAAWFGTGIYLCVFRRLISFVWYFGFLPNSRPCQKYHLVQSTSCSVAVLPIYHFKETWTLIDIGIFQNRVPQTQVLSPPFKAKWPTLQLSPPFWGKQDDLDLNSQISQFVSPYPLCRVRPGVSGYPEKSFEFPFHHFSKMDNSKQQLTIRNTWSRHGHGQQQHHLTASQPQWPCYACHATRFGRAFCNSALICA